MVAIIVWQELGLHRAHQQLLARGKPLQLVLVSHDTSPEEFAAHHAKLPFPAIPFATRLRAQLAEKFHVSTLPTVVLLASDGELITTDGLRLLRSHLGSFPWTSAPPPESPHWQPNLDRLLRRAPVHPGPQTPLSSYLPVNFLRLRSAVHTYEEAVDALRQADDLATLLTVQASFLKQHHFLTFSMLEHLFTQLLPLPIPAKHPELDDCIWSKRRNYQDQHDLGVLLDRLAEHFAAAVLSLVPSATLDAVRIVVPSAVAAIADAVLRQPAIDKPSLVSRALKLFTFGSPKLLAAQSANLACLTPELNVARTKIIDYFAQQDDLIPVFQWELETYVGTNTERFMSLICSEVAYPRSQTELAAYECDRSALLIK